VSGRAVATDVVEASARAYLQAVNKLVSLGTPTGQGRDGQRQPAAPVRSPATTATAAVGTASANSRQPAAVRRDGQVSGLSRFSEPAQAAQDAMGRVFGVAVQGGEA
jgi:hypothetical protein